MNNTKLVPFGKYKDQPIEILLNDTNYSEWMINQDGFKDKYSWVYSYPKPNLRIN